MLIEIKGLTRSYHVDKKEIQVLDNFDFSLEEGEFIAVMGRSGCGKSTLLRIIGLMDGFDGGEFRFCGADVKKLSDRKLSRIRNSDIGFVFQNFDLIPEYTVLENLELPLGYAGVKRAQRKRRAMEVLEKFALADKANSYPGRLSGGQQQRVAVARAIINEPKMILADEPTGNLDSDNTRTVMELFSELHKSGISIVVVTHDELAASFAEKTLLLG